MNHPFDAHKSKAFFQRYRTKFVVSGFVAVFVLGFLSSLALFGSGGSDVADGATPDTADVATTWTCSMHPQIRKSGPGSCPICGMDLIPVAKSVGGMRTLAVSPEAKALMSIQTSPVERRYVDHDVLMVGKVEYDETRLGHITAWIPGRLDRLYVDFTGIEIKQGHHMVYMYSEELYAAQEELIQASKFARARRRGTSLIDDGVDLVDLAREKLRLWGLTAVQIKAIEQQQKPSDHVTIYAPMSGVVVEKLRQEGDRVRVGDRIYTVADMTHLWVKLDAYESDLDWLRYGQRVTFTTEAYPGEEFNGLIAFIDPVLNKHTRTIKVRVNVPNPHAKLKPEMFVRGRVRAQIAGSGRVLTPNLAGKWISPMHPEIIKDKPGKCDVCGMPLVSTESLGYVSAETDTTTKPLVIPSTAPLVTGTRAIVYVELPSRPADVDTSFRALDVAVQDGDFKHVREAFAAFSSVLDRPYGESGTAYAKRVWNDLANRLSKDALAGQRATTPQAAEEILESLSKTMDEMHEQFAPPSQPTFEGREIVLGPRTKNHYLVKHGLQEGELVVTSGAFKIDSEIQIQAKPSMMTPEGGGGGGHAHGGHGGKKKAQKSQEMTLPPKFLDQVRELDAAYQQVSDVVTSADLAKIGAAFDGLGEALRGVDGKPLRGHPRMLWKEFAMLLGNDVAEGRDVKQMQDADRVYLLLKGHMRRVREQFKLSHHGHQRRVVTRIEVPAQFQQQLGKLWPTYLALQKAVAENDQSQARHAIASLQTVLAAVDDKSLSDDARGAWHKEHVNMVKLLNKLERAGDLKTLRAEFSPFSDEFGVLIQAFGFGDVGPMYQLQCSMALGNRGAIWFQSDDQTRNPYFGVGAGMFKCSTGVELISGDAKDPHKGHQHDE